MRPGIIEIYQFPPFEVAGLTEADVPELKRKVRAFMEEKYLEITKQKNH